VAGVEDIISQKLNRLDSVPDAFTSKVAQSQKQIFNEIRLLLEQFERDDSGNLLTSERNILLMSEMRSKLREVMTRSEYLTAVKSYLSEFDKQADINEAVFAKTVQYEETAVAAAMVTASKRNAADLLLGGAIDSAFYTPVVDQINQAISTNAGFVETVKSLKLVVEGGEVAGGAQVEGKLLRYAKQIASDAFALSDRSYTNEVAADLELEFYRYTGGLIEDSREFCIARNGKYYHEKEVMQWVDGGGSEESNPEPNVEWQGQYRGTNSSTIFMTCGGYNCKHTLMPVGIASVPVDVLRRNLESGNISLTEKQREILVV
jgi:hypothetical protein